VGVKDHQVQVRFDKGKVVVAAIPDDETGLLLGFPDYSFIVHSSVDHHSQANKWLIFFPFFNGTLVEVQVFKSGKTLACLIWKVSLRHGMPNSHHMVITVQEKAGHPARGGALAGAGPGGTDTDDRDCGPEISVPGAQQPEAGSRG
jgi:hypothetical protein